jgi:ATP-dependent DNA helicase RecG
VREGFFGREMVHPRYSIVAEGAALPQGLTPVYPAGAGVGQALLRTAIARALADADLSDTLPESVRSSYSLGDFEASVRFLHQPPPDSPQEALAERSHPAWSRIKFDELLAQQLSLKRAQIARSRLDAPVLRSVRSDAIGERGEFGLTQSLTKALIERLPFELTAAQKRVWKEIQADLAVAHPMHRLLQGDVGSGKTVVAALAALQAIDSGYQAALMAPTEILAEQHFRKLSGWVEALGVEVAWLTGSLPKKDKDAARQRVESGDAQLVIGTHALIQDEVVFRRLGLAIVDEQHRFGVGQRLALRAKASESGKSGGVGESSPDSPLETNQPHQLMMSATPIPRTLAMSYLADLEVSTIDELPPGRKPVVTKLINQGRREEVVERVRIAAKCSRQIYWVCPLIEESEALQLKTAVETHAALSSALPELKVGLVHGRIGSKEKAEAMAAFARGTTDVLVATTVIEVGVDVPNASLMVVEHAERFGLSQLHQLRGRVGRGVDHEQDAACILLYQTPLSQTACARLRIIHETGDGFEIARRDLDLRGPGEFLGQRQSGLALLRFADLASDQRLLQNACEAALRMLRDYPEHAERHLQRWMGGREDFLKA